MCKNVRYANVESAILCRSVPLSRSPFLSLLHVLYILISRQRYRAVLLGSHVDRRSIRFGTRAHPQTRTYAHIYVHSHTCSCFHPSPSHCRRYPRVLQRNSANHSRAYSDACHNERRATFCFGPVGRKYRPFWIFNFQRSSKPLRAPPPLSSSLSPPCPPSCPRSPSRRLLLPPHSSSSSPARSSARRARIRKSAECTGALYGRAHRRLWRN